MSREVTVNASLTVRKINAADGRVLVDRKYSRGYVADMTGRAGPTPETVLAKLASQGGTQVNLAAILTRPGWCWMENLGPADGSAPTAAEYVTVGMWNAQTRSFMPLLEFPAGLGLPVLLSRDVQEIYQGPGSGTAAAGETARLMLIANSKQQYFNVGAFEF